MVELCTLNFSSVDVLQRYCISDLPGPFYVRDIEMKDVFLKRMTLEEEQKWEITGMERITSKCTQSDFITFTDTGYNKET